MGNFKCNTCYDQGLINVEPYGSGNVVPCFCTSGEKRKKKKQFWSVLKTISMLVIVLVIVVFAIRHVTLNF